jgi:hypothetical protein
MSEALFEQIPNPGSDRAYAKFDVFDFSPRAYAVGGHFATVSFYNRATPWTTMAAPTPASEIRGNQRRFVLYSKMSKSHKIDKIATPAEAVRSAAPSRRRG